jgi:hypothetical protein
LPLYKMQNFESLIEKFKELSGVWNT